MAATERESQVKSTTKVLKGELTIDAVDAGRGGGMGKQNKREKRLQKWGLGGEERA